MLKVIKSGFYTSIQDTGRFGFRAYGVPVSGAMDSYSSQFANAVLGNDKVAAVLEITMTGPTLQFLEPTLISVSGADMSPRLNDKPIHMNIAVQIHSNDILSFGRLKSGMRTYLAIKGGFLSERILESRSMYKLITPNDRLSDNDTLGYDKYSSGLEHRHAKVKHNKSIKESITIEAYKGPEFNMLPYNMQTHILNADLKISKLNNRMAYQLEPLFKNHLGQILTAPVLPGTVQLTPSGQLIVLMRDCQTTGGYPRVFQLTEEAINSLSQKVTSNNLKIRLKD